MEGPRQRDQSLANRIVRVTTAIGLTTLAIAALVLLLETTRMSSGYVKAQDSASLQSVSDGLEARLALARRAVDIAALSGGSPTVEARRSVLASAVAGSAGAADFAAVSGGTQGTTANTARPAIVVPEAITRVPPSGDTAYVQHLSGGATRIWLVRSVRLRDGSAGIVVLRLRPAFLVQALNSAVRRSGAGVAIIIDPVGHRVLAQNIGNMDAATCVWDPQAGGTGGVLFVRNSEGTLFTGPYTGVEALPGLAWRAAVVESAGTGLLNSMEAILPALLVLMLGGLIGIAVTFLFARRLVGPLRDLEDAALQGANGSYVKPLPSSSNDEIGRVSEAFNAVSLRLNALHDLSQLLASSSRLDQVLDGILTATGHIVGPGVSAVYLVEQGGDRLVPATVKGPSPENVEPVSARDDGWLARTLMSEEPLMFDLPPELLAEELPGLEIRDASTAIAAPLVAGHEALGVVVVVPEAGRLLSQAEVEMLRTFSAQAAVAVQNSRLFANEAESRHMAEELREIAETLVRPTGLNEAVAYVEKALSELLGATWVHLAVLDRPALGLPAADARDSDAELLGVAMRSLRSTEGCRPEPLDSEDPAVAALLERTGSTAIVVSPISLGSEHGAVLGVGLPRAALDRTGADVIEAVCSELALALDNAYFYRRALSRAANLETIFRISQVVGSSLQINVVLNRVLDIVQKIFSADTVVLMRYDTAKRMIVSDMARGQVSSELLSLELRPGEDIPGYVFASGEPAAFRDLHVGMGGVGGEAAARELRSLIAVPLIARNSSIGVLMAFSVEAGAFSDEDVSVLQTFAAQAALAIDTARLYSREHDLSQTLQSSIMPEKLPRFPEIDTGTVYVPAAAPIADIGGDYFDAVRAPDGRIVLAMADVCGKGVEAATKTSMIKFSVRALVAAGFSPARVMGEVNRMVCESGAAGDIVTLWVGALDADRGALAWANGGHPPALLRRADGSIERLGATGPLLGALPTVVYDEDVIAVAPGDMLVLYTDGVTEARSGNKLFGEERLRRTLEASGAAREVAERILDSVRRYVRGDLRDDVAILVATIEGQADDGVRDQERV